MIVKTTVAAVSAPLLLLEDVGQEAKFGSGVVAHAVRTDTSESSRPWQRAV
jgi:hypothetical protein